jgi:hypothetical protein
MTRARSAPALALVLLLTAAACAGGKPASGGETPGHRGGGHRPVGLVTVQATLGEDVRELERAAREGDDQSRWPERTSFVGWTADHRAAYRSLVCNTDELGGRGPYCELRVCTAAAGAGADGPDCVDAAQFELYGDIDFDPAAVTAAAEDAVKALGPLDTGSARELDTVTVSTANRGLSLDILGQRVVLSEPSDETPELGMVEAHVTYVGDSPDDRCRVALGDGKFLSEYEGVEGKVPYLFAAVACREP